MWLSVYVSLGEPHYLLSAATGPRVAVGRGAAVPLGRVALSVEADPHPHRRLLDPVLDPRVPEAGHNSGGQQVVVKKK